MIKSIKNFSYEKIKDAGAVDHEKRDVKFTKSNEV